MTISLITKRRFVSRIGLLSGAAAAAIFAPAVVIRASAAESTGIGEKVKELFGGGGKEEVTPPEDLMREHGVLDRLLLVYEAGIRKFAANDDFDPALLTQAATIVRDFINDYHEQSEEEQVFPRFKQAGKMVELVDTLWQQHRAGRKVTENIIRLAPGSRNDGDARRQVVSAMQSFIGMYRPHAAREDTELFPKLKDVVSSNEYDAMAEDFEKKEHELFGDDGFEKMTARVATLERAFGINELEQFTPHI